MSQKLRKLTDEIIKFRDERDWRQFHTLKNLFVSLNLEAAELMELAQWKTDGELESLKADPDFQNRVGEECADVMIYMLLIADQLGLDILDEVGQKIKINNERYPVTKARGRADKYHRL